MRNLPRWLEQTYPNCQIILLDSNSTYANTAIIAKRHGLQITKNEINDNKIIYFDNSTNMKELLLSLKTDMVLMTDTNTCPLPYFADILMCKAEKETPVKCGNSVAIGRVDDKFQPPYNHTGIDESLLYPVKNQYVKKVSIIIPVMDRLDNLVASAEAVFSQTYPHIQIVIVDYSSRVPIQNSVQSLCTKYSKTFSTDPKSNANVILLRINNLKYFNISHAYNYAISQLNTDIISLLCADSVPWDFYIETCVNLLTDTNLVQSHWGLHTITYGNWKKLNGHQEFITGWGSEDDDFRIRANLMGLDINIVPSKFVYQIKQDDSYKTTNRQIKNLSESSLTNAARFRQYIATHGFVANYSLPIGKEEPIQYQSTVPVELPLRLWIFRNPELDNNNLSADIKYDTEFNLHYKITREDFDCHPYCNKFDNFYIESDADIRKYFDMVQTKYA